jgi:hypothetical protein
MMIPHLQSELTCSYGGKNTIPNPNPALDSLSHRTNLRSNIKIFLQLFVTNYTRYQLPLSLRKERFQHLIA